VSQATTHRESTSLPKMEPRARAGRHKNHVNFPDDLRNVLIAYGAPTHPDIVPTTQHPDSETYLTRAHTSSVNTSHRPTPYSIPSGNGRIPNAYPETLRVLDEILTDFIIETCHGAVRHAGMQGRQKINNRDFEFVIRRDARKMGRVQDLLRRHKKLKEDRKLVSGGQEEGGKIDEGGMLALAGMVGEDSGTGKGKGRGKGKRKKRKGVPIVEEGESGAGIQNARGGSVGEEDLDVDGDLDGDDVMDEDADEEGEPPRKRARSDTG
jgi:transcription initiation factor TFIID subunit 13